MEYWSKAYRACKYINCSSIQLAWIWIRITRRYSVNTKESACCRVPFSQQLASFPEEIPGIQIQRAINVEYLFHVFINNYLSVRISRVLYKTIKPQSALPNAFTRKRSK